MGKEETRVRRGGDAGERRLARKEEAAWEEEGDDRERVGFAREEKGTPRGEEVHEEKGGP